MAVRWALQHILLLAQLTARLAANDTRLGFRRRVRILFWGGGTTCSLKTSLEN